MMKILSFFLLFVKFASAELHLVPFGAESTFLPPNKSVATGFDVSGPILTVVRMDRLNFTNSNPNQCERLWKCLPERGEKLTDPSLIQSLWGLSRDRSAQKFIMGCTHFPCSVKLTLAEAEELKKASKDDRLKRYFEVLQKRFTNYQKTGERLAYEGPRVLQDPWAWFQKMGALFLGSLSDQSQILHREINLDPKQMKTIRQLLAYETLKDVKAQVFTERLRDIYTSHYFDAWGEWSQLKCQAGSARLAQSLVVELDLLKKKDMLSRLSRGEMKRTLRTQGQLYLEKRFLALKACSAAM